MAEIFEELINKREKINKEDFPYLIDLIKSKNYEEFVDYFRNSIYLIECDYMKILKGYKLSHSENVQFTENDKKYYGQVEELVKINLLNEQFGFVKLRLYYTKDDLLEVNPKIIECTENDLFLTEKTRWFNLTDCFKKIEVQPIEKYDEGELQYIDKSFYTRSQFDTRTQKFKTPIQQWKKYCFCDRLYNPLDKFLQCDKCNDWVHYECSKLSDQDLKKIQNMRFYCGDCGEKYNLNSHEVQSLKQKKGKSMSKKTK